MSLVNTGARKGGVGFIRGRLVRGPLGRLLALAVERVEIVAQRDEEILGLTPAQATREARVVVVERVRDDEMWPAVIVGPIGQLVVVGVAVIKEPAFLNDKAPCIGARRADVPADRSRTVPTGTPRICAVAS